MLSDWHYEGLAAEAYDLWFGEEPFVDQKFYQRQIEAQGGAALEVACGTGRLLLPYLRDGLEVEGVDASGPMLDLCRQKASRLQLAPVLHQQRMQQLELPRRYRTLFIPFCSFQILAGRDEAFEALRRFRDHLEPGGSLLVSLYVPWRDFELESQWRLRRCGTRPTDGATVMIHECTRSDRYEQVQSLWLRLELWHDGRLTHSELRPHTMRWYHRHEFEMMLAQAGFGEIKAWGDYSRRPASAASETVVFEARR